MNNHTHFLKLLDFTPAEIRYLLDLSRNFKDLKRAGTPHRYLEGKNIVLLFEKTSLTEVWRQPKEAKDERPTWTVTNIHLSTAPRDQAAE